MDTVFEKKKILGMHLKYLGPVHL